MVNASNKEDAKLKALAHLKTLHDDPFELMQAAADAVNKFTGCANGYVALLEDPEDDDEDDDDEEGEGEEAEAPPAEEEEGEGEPKEMIDGFNYDDKFFKYVAAGPENQFMVGQKLEREQGPNSYALTTSRQLVVDVPNCLDQEDIHYFKGLARPGAYFAAAIILKSGERMGMVCGDSLKSSTGGSGRKLVEDDKDFIQEVARAIAAALDAGEEMRQAQAAETGDVDDVLAEAEEVVASDEAKEETAKIAEATVIDGETAPAPEEAPPAVELSPEEQALKADGQKLKAVNNILLDLKANALAELKSYPRPPKHTYKVLKAILFILGHKKSEMDEWNKARMVISQDLIIRMREYDAEGPRNAAAWKGVRGAIKGLEEPDVAKESKAGAILYKWVLAVKAVSDSAVAMRAAAKAAEGGGEEEAPAEES